MATPLTMFIVVRRDLLKDLQWPLGAVMTQACHAVSAALWTFRDHPETIEYTKDLERMHKVTLEVKNEMQMQRLVSQLREHGVQFVEWMEQPENLLTALCTRPYRRSDIIAVSDKSQPAITTSITTTNTNVTIGDLLRKCQLFK